MSYDVHVFVCTAAPEKAGKCGHKNSEFLRKNLKELVSQQSWASRVRVNSAGCLGHCEKGISVVIYPQGKWHFFQTDSDVSFLFEQIQSLAQNDA